MKHLYIPIVFFLNRIISIHAKNIIKITNSQLHVASSEITSNKTNCPPSFENFNCMSATQGAVLVGIVLAFVIGILLVIIISWKTYNKSKLLIKLNLPVTLKNILDSDIKKDNYKKNIQLQLSKPPQTKVQTEQYVLPASLQKKQFKDSEFQKNIYKQPESETNIYKQSEPERNIYKQSEPERNIYKQSELEQNHLKQSEISKREKINRKLNTNNSDEIRIDMTSLENIDKKYIPQKSSSNARSKSAPRKSDDDYDYYQQQNLNQYLQQQQNSLQQTLTNTDSIESRYQASDEIVGGRTVTRKKSMVLESFDNISANRNSQYQPSQKVSRVEMSNLHASRRGSIKNNNSDFINKKPIPRK